jgi:hypothetical protein
MKKWQWSAIGLILALLLLAGIGASRQILAERREANRFPAPGQLVDIGGRRCAARVGDNPARVQLRSSRPRLE